MKKFGESKCRKGKNTKIKRAKMTPIDKTTNETCSMLKVTCDRAVHVYLHIFSAKNVVIGSAFQNISPVDNLTDLFFNIIVRTPIPAHA